MANTTARQKRRFSDVVLSFVFIVLLIACVAVFIFPYAERAGGAVAGSADWMKTLDDGLYLSELTLPGTHDSATRFVGLPLFSRCQSSSVANQLEDGFRYLDIRLGVCEKDGEERLALMHGFTYCHSSIWPWSERLYFDDVLKSCADFLKAHPSETVIIAVKQEHGSESVKELQALISRAFAQYPALLLTTDTMPTLGEARGSVVLMRRYDDEAGFGAAAGLPLIWTDQGGHKDVNLGKVTAASGALELTVQDRFEYDEIDKWAVFEDCLGARGSAKNAVCLNFLSTKGTLKYGHPYYFAARLNRHLVRHDIPKNSGWIVVDFGNAEAAQHIYSVNFN